MIKHLKKGETEVTIINSKKEIGRLKLLKLENKENKHYQNEKKL